MRVIGELTNRLAYEIYIYVDREKWRGIEKERSMNRRGKIVREYFTLILDLSRLF